MNLLHFSDPHLFADPDEELRGVRTLQSLRGTVAAALQRNGLPDAILVSGDIAQDESADAYGHFRATFADLGVPVLCLPGNHDDPAIMRDLLDRPPFSFCGHLHDQHWLVAALSTHLDGQAAGFLANSELERLDLLLRRFPKHQTLVALHHHPVPSGSAWIDELGLENAAALLALLARHRQVRGCLFGHIHQALQRRHGRLAMLSVPSTCDQFRRGSDHFAVDELPPGYRWLRLQPDGLLSSAVHWCENERPAA